MTQISPSEAELKDEVEQHIIVAMMYAWEQGKKQVLTPRDYTLHEKPVLNDTVRLLLDLFTRYSEQQVLAAQTTVIKRLKSRTQAHGATATTCVGSEKINEVLWKLEAELHNLKVQKGGEG